MEAGRFEDEGDCRLVDIGGGQQYALARYGAPDGYPVLALHGAPASHIMFQPSDATARALGLSITAPDREGYGRTRIDADPTLASRAEALERLVDALALERLAVLGVSGGCPYAAALAARLGARVSALALVSPMGPVRDLSTTVPVAFGHRRFFLDLPRAPRLLGGVAHVAAMVYLRFPHTTTRLFARLLGGEDASILERIDAHALLVSMTREAFRNGPEGGLRDLEIFSRPWQVDLASIRAPTTLWQGDADVVVPKAVALALAQRIPGCKTITVAGAGHFWVLDHVAEVLGALKDMIGT